MSQRGRMIWSSRAQNRSSNLNEPCFFGGMVSLRSFNESTASPSHGKSDRMAENDAEPTTSPTGAAEVAPAYFIRNELDIAGIL
jgi:hypothetical protein